MACVIRIHKSNEGGEQHRGRTLNESDGLERAVEQCTLFRPSARLILPTSPERYTLNAKR